MIVLTVTIVGLFGCYSANGGANGAHFVERFAFGQDDPQGNATQYTGRENDGTELYFYRARYYDSALKSFIAAIQPESAQG